MRDWHYRRDGRVCGPFTDSQIRALARSGQLHPSDHVTHNRLDAWYPARDVSGLDLPEPNDAPAPADALPPALQVEPDPSPFPAAGDPPATAAAEPDATVIAGEPAPVAAPGSDTHGFRLAKALIAAALALACLAPALAWYWGRQAAAGAPAPAPAATADRTVEDGPLPWPAAAALLGAFLARTCPGSRVLLLGAPPDTAPEGGDEPGPETIAALSAAFGAQVTIRATVAEPPPATPVAAPSPGTPAPDQPQPASRQPTADFLQACLDAHPDCDLLVSFVGLPDDLESLPAWQAPRTPPLRVAVLAGPTRGLAPALRSGRLLAVVDPHPGPQAVYPFAPVATAKAFRDRFRLVTPASLDAWQTADPDLFGGGRP